MNVFRGFSKTISDYGERERERLEKCSEITVRKQKFVQKEKIPTIKRPFIIASP